MYSNTMLTWVLFNNRNIRDSQYHQKSKVGLVLFLEKKYAHNGSSFRDEVFNVRVSNWNLKVVSSLCLDDEEFDSKQFS